MQESILGTERIGKLLAKMALPAIVSQLINLLYNIIDRVYIGHIEGIGDLALTGVGLCVPIVGLVGGFACMFGMGGSPQAAISMGKGDNDRAENIMGNCVTGILVSAILLITAVLIWGRQFLMMFGASADTIEYAWGYLQIYILGSVFMELTLGLNMFITAQGFPITSMVAVIVGTVLNTIIDPILIFGFNMGVRGAAIATVISQFVSCVFIIKFLVGKKTMLKIKLPYMMFKPSIILPVMALGVSPFIMQVTESLLNISFNSSLQRYGGDLAVGAMTICASVCQLVILPLQGIGHGAQPIVSYNYGANRPDRVKAILKLQISVCITFAIIVVGIIELFPQVFIQIFNDKPELIEISTWSLRVYAAGLFMFGVQMACQHSFLALGQAKVSMFLACLRKLILLIPLIYVLPMVIENKVFAVFLAEPIADITSALITLTLFVLTAKRLLKGLESKPAEA
ncbi:MAG: MATE family efflux transporter [Lachnospiraceae bacterium]|nr:MATE family efflux transporter [Lachnospiraceae bacterium]